MLWAWKADKRSLKSWYIRGDAFQRVRRNGEFSNRVHPFMHGSTQESKARKMAFCMCSRFSAWW